jgi:hypothetical protein
VTETPTAAASLIMTRALRRAARLRDQADPNEELIGLADDVANLANLVAATTQASLPTSLGHASHAGPNGLDTSDGDSSEVELLRSNAVGGTAAAEILAKALRQHDKPVTGNETLPWLAATAAAQMSRDRHDLTLLATVDPVRDLLRTGDVWDEDASTESMVVVLVERCRDLENDRADLAGIKDEVGPELEHQTPLQRIRRIRQHLAAGVAHVDGAMPWHTDGHLDTLAERAAAIIRYQAEALSRISRAQEEARENLGHDD